MAISTYSELQATIADFLMRQDLAAVIPSFITLAESGFNRRLRHWRMETIATAAFNEPTEYLPSDWVETIRLELDGSGPLRLISPQEMMKERANTWETGNPRFFTHTAGLIELWPAPTSSTGSGRLTYFAKVPPLSDSATSNWLLEEAPDLYLYGALVHSAPYLQEDGRVAIWGGIYADILNGLNEQSEKARFSGPLVMRGTFNG